VTNDKWKQKQQRDIGEDSRVIAIGHQSIESLLLYQVIETAALLSIESLTSPKEYRRCSKQNKREDRGVIGEDKGVIVTCVDYR
jgi:hypothetical protein